MGGDVDPGWFSTKTTQPFTLLFFPRRKKEPVLVPTVDEKNGFYNSLLSKSSVSATDRHVRSAQPAKPGLEEES